MNLRELGFAVIINNLRSENPDTAVDVQALTAALETVGFKVKCYDDCNAQVSLRFFGVSVDTIDTVQGVCNGF